MEDVFNSPCLTDLTNTMTSFLCDRREYEYLSIDCTIKCCVAVMGQESWRTNVVVRNMAPFDDATAYRRVLTVRGRTGAVLGMIPVASEKAEEVSMALGFHLPSNGLTQVVCVAADNTTSKLYAALRRVMPNLQALCLDPIHLAITYECPDCLELLSHDLVLKRAKFRIEILLKLIALREDRYATWKKKTPGALLLRKILRKFLAFDDVLGDQGWGPYYHGYETRDLNALEDRRRGMVQNGSMLKATAKRVAENLDATTPFRSRLSFIESLAALSALHPEDMRRKVTGANVSIHHILWCACAPDRLEWLWNNLRWRHSTRLLVNPSLIGRASQF